MKHYPRSSQQSKLSKIIKPVSALSVAALLLASHAADASEQIEPMAAASGAPVSIDLAFVTHLDMDLPEQDVFIERVQGSGEVFRVTKGDHDMNAPLFKAATAIAHDPFDPAAVGPHAKGEALGMTLGQWLAHTGTARYTCAEGRARLQADYTGLVPNGVYTLWHAFLALPPTTPFSGSLDLPLGARDGSESVFSADADGRAALDIEFSPCLQMSDVWTTATLAINWHSDGNTYGADPGEFGLNAHIPLFVMLPPRDGLQ